MLARLKRAMTATSSGEKVREEMKLSRSDAEVEAGRASRQATECGSASRAALQQHFSARKSALRWSNLDSVLPCFSPSASKLADDMCIALHVG